MNEKNPDQPWEQLEELVQHADAEKIEDFLDAIPAGETSRTISRMSEELQNQLLTVLSPDEAADLIDQLGDAQAAEIMHHLKPAQAAAIIKELPSNEQADLMAELDPDEVEAILAEMDSRTVVALRRLSKYDAYVAGGLMVTEYLVYTDDLSVGQAIDDLRTNSDKYRDYQVQYAFVVDHKRKLVGVLRMRDLLLARSQDSIRELMIRNPLTVSDQTPLTEMHDFFEQHDFLGVPVVDESGVLAGIVRRVAVEEAMADRTEDDYLKSQGIVREELRTMPIGTRSRRRLAWLSINVFLNLIAASVIAAYQSTLEQVIALAVFLPIISDMSGCSGNQAVAVSMRELSLGLVRPGEVFLVWIKEISVGMINGLALGVLIAVVAILWQGNPYLGLVVGVAMGVNTLIAVSLGGTLPLIMKLIRVDPALASGPILTTVTDMCGFFILLSLATALLPRLLG